MVSKGSPAVRTTGTAPMKNELPLDVIQSFNTPEDVERYFRAQGIELSYGEEVSDGYEKLENKDKLIGASFIIIDWRTVDSTDYAQEFVTIRLMTLEGAKYRISDGSTGIYRQLCDISTVRAAEGKPNVGVVVKNGLTKSQYWVSTADGKAMSEGDAEQTPAELKKKAITYYLNF